MANVAIVTGETSGIGLSTALALKEAGCTVYGFSRRGQSAQEGILHISCDITDEAQLQQAVAQVLEREGHIDLLVNNAGFGISGAVEFTSITDAKRLLDVNLFGTAQVIQAVLPAMRSQKSGRIVNISSVAAPIAIPFQAWYSVSKAGINALSCALENEVRPFGISVCAVMPGDIKTGFTAAREKCALGDDVYQGRISRSVATMERDEQNGMDPAAAGRFIARVALKKSGKPLYTIGLQYQLFVLLSRLLPCRLINWLVGLIYAK